MKQPIRFKRERALRLPILRTNKQQFKNSRHVSLLWQLAHSLLIVWPVREAFEAIAAPKVQSCQLTEVAKAAHTNKR